MCMIYVLKGLDTSEENLLFKKSEGITENFLVDLCVVAARNTISGSPVARSMCVLCRITGRGKPLSPNNFSWGWSSSAAVSYQTHCKRWNVCVRSDSTYTHIVIA